MSAPQTARSWSPYRLWAQLPRIETSHLPDIIMFGVGLAIFYAILAVGKSWLGPFTPAVEISHSPLALPAYAGYSLLRITIAYVLSLAFTLVYGYVAYNQRAEKFMIPLLDVLQSIPVLSFLPGVMLAMVAMFPGKQLGVEAGAILLIFTGQVWNMAFSFYASLKTVPRDLREAAIIYRFSRWQRFMELDLPFSTIGLVWNSMMSVAGGWFFLMACEMFVLGARDFRLPGLGSYLQTAASAGDTRSILWGVVTMITVIVLLDQFIWRPVIAWAEKFKVEQVESTNVPRSWVLTMFQHSRALARLRKRAYRPLRERVMMYFARQHTEQGETTGWSPAKLWTMRIVGIVFLGLVTYAVIKVAVMLSGLQRMEMLQLGSGLGATFLRVMIALVVGAAWTIPAGVAIGFNPKLARIAQPLAQIAASVPATALFPVVLLLLIRVGGGLGLGSIVLLLLGTQWYILFNVIAGAMAVPTDLKECCSVFGICNWDRWRKLILPGIFPYLVTGLVTASGGAWNASIVAEYFHFKGQTYTTTGLGAVISQATDSGNFDELLAATILMAAAVVTVNRLLWRRLYNLAETRYRLES